MSRRRTLIHREVISDILANDSDSDLDEIDDSDADSDFETEREVEGDDSSSTDSDDDMDVELGAGDGAEVEWRRIPDDHNDNYIPVWCPTYSRGQGPQFPDNLALDEPIDYFYLLFPDEAFELICERTNSYASEFFDTPIDLPPASRYRNWVDCTVDEIKAYVGIQIMMRMCSKPQVTDYWALSDIDKTPGFREVMSRNRYQLISSFLHFCNNEERVARGQPGYDPLFKIRPLLDIVGPLGRTYYTPSREISIDEAMRKFKGRIYFRQYIPNKPCRWGIKLWCLCESETGYLLDWNVYTGKSTEGNENDAEGGLGHSVVWKLMRDSGYLNCGHHLYVDNYYTSPALFSALRDAGTGACGTVKANRKNMPAGIVPKQLKLKKGDDPVFYRKGDFLSCTWQDTARVNFLSTLDNTGCTTKQIRSKQSDTGFRDVKKPNVACSYNNFMGGVDLFDQRCSTYPYPHKVKKWYHAIYHFTVEAALVNAYLLYMASNPNSKLTSAKFRREVGHKLCASAPKNSSSNLGHSAAANHSRLQGRHFPMMYENPKYKPNCTVCSYTTGQPKRKQTRYGCRDCTDGAGRNVPMCVPDCFTRYHTMIHYRN